MSYFITFINYIIADLKVQEKNLLVHFIKTNKLIFFFYLF